MFSCFKSEVELKSRKRCVCVRMCAGRGFDARDLTWEPRGGSPKCFSLNDVNINSKVKVYNFFVT